MRTVINEILFGKNAKLSGLIALLVVGSIALGCNCNKSFDLANMGNQSNTSSPANTRTDTTDDSSPSESVVEGLVKDTISQFAEAVDTGDFSDLHANASQDFQSSYTVDQMATAFKSYTDKKRIVIPVMNKVPTMTAEFNRPPSIRSEKGLKILMAQGEFKTKPYKLRYDFEYVMRGGEWKLLKLVINIP